MKPAGWGWVLSALLFVVLVFIQLDRWYVQDRFESKVEQMADLKARMVTLEALKFPWRFRGLNDDAVFFASELTGCPAKLITAGRQQENGLAGNELGYNGASRFVTQVYPYDQAQYGEYARRVNQIAWNWVMADKKRWAEVTERIAAEYHASEIPAEQRKYARDLRLIFHKVEPPPKSKMKAKSRSRKHPR